MKMKTAQIVIIAIGVLLLCISMEQCQIQCVKMGYDCVENKPTWDCNKR